MSIGALGDSVSGLSAARPHVGRSPSLAGRRMARPAATAAVVRAPVVARRRIETVDAARAIATLGIILVHSIESTQLGPIGMFGMFAVPFYVFLAMYFQATAFRRDPDRPLHRYVYARVRRLYLPFLAWSVIYLMLRNLKHGLLSGAAPLWPQMPQLWVGTAHHLWFLPFLTVVTILSAMVAPSCARSAVVRWSVVGLAGVAGLVLAVAPRPDWLNYVDGGEGYLFLQSWRALPAALLGLALGWALAGRDFWSNPRFSYVGRVAGWAGAALTLATTLWLLQFGYSRVARTLGGLGWAAFALAGWRGPVLGALAAVGRYAYGAYLAHVLVIEGVQAAAHAAGFGASPGLDVITIACGMAGGFGIAVALAGCRRLAWLNG